MGERSKISQPSQPTARIPMRYHAKVHDNKDNNAIFECHVIAENSGAAREKIKNYLINNNEENYANMLISLVELRENIESSLILID